MTTKAQSKALPNRQSIDRVLSLRLRPNNLIYERPIKGSPLRISNGAIVVIQDGSIQGLIKSEKALNNIKLVPTLPISASIEHKGKALPTPIEMNVLGQCIYLDRVVELLTIQEITGKNIKSIVKGNKLRLDDLRTGVYIVRVYDKGLTHTSKFILR